MRPSIGRIVHFVTREGKHLPAIIVLVHDEQLVNLQVFLREGLQARDFCKFDNDEQMPDTWHWPERAE